MNTEESRIGVQLQTRFLKVCNLSVLQLGGNLSLIIGTGLLVCACALQRFATFSFSIEPSAQYRPRYSCILCRSGYCHGHFNLLSIYATETVYAKQNGGNFDFIVEKSNGKSIPTTQAFWDWLMMSSKEWGMAVYEQVRHIANYIYFVKWRQVFGIEDDEILQDWLHNEWEGLNATLSSPTLSTKWLEQMGLGATKAGIPIQYCMACELSP